MATTSRLIDNLRAILSVSEERRDAGEVGDRPMSDDTIQHGSGSLPIASSSTPESDLRRQFEQSNPYDERIIWLTLN